MREKISRYILAISFALLLPAGGMGQVRQVHKAQKVPLQLREDKADKGESLFSVRGVSLSADLFGAFYSLFGSSISSEVGLDINLRNQLFPVFEAGYASFDDTNENNLIHSSCAAPYFRVGLNYNIFYRKGKEAAPSFGYVGFRYGFSSFTYDIDGPSLNDPVWGGSVPVRYSNVSGNSQWMELCAGIKAKIWKNFYMGWCIRYKARINIKNGPNSNPPFIPGFGERFHTTFGGTYSLIFNLPFKK